MPGPLVLARWHAGRPEIIARASEQGVPDGVFLTPDGTFWYAWDVLARLVGGRWQGISPLPDGTTKTPRALRAVNASGPPWILVSDLLGGIARLSYGPGFTNVRLESIAEHAAASDAIGLDEKRILVAGEEGLKLYAVETGTLSKWTGPAPEGKVSRLARDKRGRIWLGGQGLWLLEADEKRMHALASLNVTGGEVSALAADPGHDDGVIVVTRANEVAFVQAAPEAHSCK
jgi:sugar lactone lactonase YvrE